MKLQSILIVLMLLIASLSQAQHKTGYPLESTFFELSQGVHSDKVLILYEYSGGRAVIHIGKQRFTGTFSKAPGKTTFTATAGNTTITGTIQAKIVRFQLIDKRTGRSQSGRGNEYETILKPDAVVSVPQKQ